MLVVGCWLSVVVSCLAFVDCCKVSLFSCFLLFAVWRVEVGSFVVACWLLLLLVVVVVVVAVVVVGI